MVKERLLHPIDAANMYRKGESFHFAARYIQRGGVGAMGGGWCAWPTSLAFACEAYLKVLAQLEHNEPPFPTHNLRQLFHDLPPATQRELRKRWLKLDGKMLKQKPLPFPGMVKQAKSFEEALNLSAMAFVDWRYNDAAPSSWQLGSLPEILRNHLLTIKPDWRPFEDSATSLLNPALVRPNSERLPSVFPTGFPTQQS